MDRHVRRRIGQAPPQAGDMGFQRVGRHFVVEAIKPFLKHRARHDLTGAAQQNLQQVGFTPRRIDRVARDGDLTRYGIERQIAGRQDSGEARSRTAEKCPAACQQLVHLERLDQIVVGPGIEPGDPVGETAARGRHQDRDSRACGGGTASATPVRRRRAIPDQAGSGHSPPWRWRLRLRSGEAKASTVKPALRQPALHQGRKPFIVFDEQDPHTRFRPVTIAHTRFSPWRRLS